MSTPPSAPTFIALLGDPALHRALLANVRRHVPPSEAEDIVQATLTEALASSSVPEDAASQKRWVWGIARHKVVDFHRRSRREKPGDVPDVEADSAPHGAAELLRWAENELPEGEGAAETLEWLLREGDGDKLEHIAADENVPATRIRQRVSRLRKHFRARWAAQAAAIAAAIVTAIAIAWWLRRPKEEEPIVREIPAPGPNAPVEDPSALRRLALEKCATNDWAPCLDGLDRAKTLDPAGDASPDVVAARKAAADATTPAPAPTPPLTTGQPKKAAPSTTSAPPPPTNFKPTAPSSTDASTPMPKSFDSGTVTGTPFPTKGGAKKPQGKASK